MRDIEVLWKLLYLEYILGLYGDVGIILQGASKGTQAGKAVALLGASRSLVTFWGLGL